MICERCFILTSNLSGYLVDKEASKKIIICGGIFTMAIGCLGIDPFMLKCNPISAAAMLCVINFGSGITQVSLTQINRKKMM